MSKTPEVLFEVHVNITEQNLRDYMMQRTYSNAGIMIPSLFGIGFLYMAVTTFGEVSGAQWWAYLIFGILFLFGVPINVWSRCRRDARRNPAFQEEIIYYLDEEGIYYGEGERQVLKWEDIHHVISTKLNVVVYATSRMAFYLPKADIGNNYQAMAEFITSKMEPGRAKFAK